MNWPWSWRGRVIEPEKPVPSFPLEELKATLAVLPKDANVVYVFWWEQPLSPAHMQVIKHNAEGHGLEVLLFTGVRRPEIYKLQKDTKEQL